MSYSKVLVNRFLIVLVLSTFIVLSLILISSSLQTDQFTSSSYIPKEKVERVSILIREWITSKSSLDYQVNDQDKNNTSSKVLVDFIDQFSCSLRVKNIIYTSAIKTLKKHPSIKENKFIESIRRYYYPFSGNNCIKIIQDLDVINRINLRVTGKELQIRKIVKTSLTENLGWHENGLCIYHKLLSEDLV